MNYNIDKLPDNWDTTNVSNIINCFDNCTSLTGIPPDIWLNDEWRRKIKLDKRGVILKKIKKDGQKNKTQI